MTHDVTRRQFLRTAGGATLLALSPDLATFAAPELIKPDKSLPLFTALPYVQPGAGSALVKGQETKVIAWQTTTTPAAFELQYGPTKKLGMTLPVQTTPRWSGDVEDGDPRFNYAANLNGLDLNKPYYYRVLSNGKPIAEGRFTTRKPRGQRVRFVAFGDNSYGDISDRAIAYHAYRAQPDFVMNTGDNVYDGGLDNEYARYFFPVYNADVAGPRLGAPLIRSTPYYTVIANHDVHDKDPAKHPVADFDKDPDSLAYYTAMYLPLNGLAQPPQPTPTLAATTNGREQFQQFSHTAGSRFPSMANYSFDYGDAHFLCLDSNIYVDPTNAQLQAWIEQDLAKTDAPWKFVVYHHPAFNVGDDHYKEQHMRVLSPLFEKHRVDIVFNGHEHSYQRTRPMRFEPMDTSRASLLNDKDRRVPGKFSIDRRFDGNAATKADGIIYITTGAGGKHLYDPEHTNQPEKWRHAEDNNADYVVKFVSDRHSLTVIDLDAKSLSLTQIDEYGQKIDQVRVTKA
ncbi:MAG: metallophosphoesterase [Abitibacteriaceae bacterium]|nr:metallophosphoesterase [Abditibacteriaceae bacterium]